MIDCRYPGEALSALWADARPGQAEWLRELVDIVFFASLETEEGAQTPVRVVFHLLGAVGVQAVREQEGFGNARWGTPAWQVIPFEPERGVTGCTIKNLVKAAPMAALARTALIVGAQSGVLRIEGIARRLRRSYPEAEREEEVFVCASTKPGQVILSLCGYPFFWYEAGGTLDVLAGVELDKLLNDKTSLINQALREICSGVISEGKAQPFETDRYYLVSRVVRTLIEVMVQTGRGGIIAFLAASSSVVAEWNGKYRVPHAARGLLRAKIAEVAEYDARQWADSLEPVPQNDDAQRDIGIAGVEGDRSRDELTELAETIGRLSSVDNAVLFGPELALLCAGYQVVGEDTAPRVIETGVPTGTQFGREFPLQQHGSRHRAAANFAERYPGSVVFISSEDGALRCLHRPLVGSETLLWTVRAAVEL